MKNVLVLMCVFCFSQAVSAQSLSRVMTLDTLGGFYAFPMVAALDSVVVNDGEHKLEFTDDDRAVIAYMERETRDLDTNKPYVTDSGSHIVRVSHLWVEIGRDRRGMMMYEDRGTTIFIVSRDLTLILALYPRNGWYEQFFLREAPPTDGRPYDGLSRPILGLVKNPDQRTLRDLLLEMLPQVSATSESKK